MSSTDESRTPDAHPNQRVEDSGSLWAKFWHGRFYRDVWLLLITGLVLLAVNGNHQRINDIQESRIFQTTTSCAAANASTNSIVTALSDFIVEASVIAPGDQPIPPNEKDPFKWTGIKEGPLRKSIEQKIPGYPSAAILLADAKKQANGLNHAIPRRDCKSEIQHVIHLPPKGQQDG